jgi:hypothetical protein
MKMGIHAAFRIFRTVQNNALNFHAFSTSLTKWQGRMGSRFRGSDGNLEWFLGTSALIKGMTFRTVPGQQ